MHAHYHTSQGTNAMDAQSSPKPPHSIGTKGTGTFVCSRMAVLDVWDKSAYLLVSGADV